MPALTQDEIKDWGLPKLREEYNAALDRCEAIKDEYGTIAGAPGSKAEEVANLLNTTNTLGKRIDELTVLEEADGVLEAHRKRVTEPVNAPPAPGGGGKQRGGDDGPRDIGGRFVESEAWKEFAEEGRKGIVAKMPLSSLWGGYKGIGEVPRKALFDSSAYPIEDDFRPEPVLELFQANNIGPLMPQGSTDAPVIKYPVENVIATGAAGVAEGAAKPEAELTFDPVTEDVTKIAVWLPLTDEALDDIPFLRSYVNARLPLFVQNEEDRQLLVTDGTSNTLVGLLERSGIDSSTSYSIGGADPEQALIDSHFSAAMRVREAFLEPDAFVEAPATWETVRLAKDANGNYLLGPPADDVPVRLWGLRGVLNQNMPVEGATNTPVLVGAFQAGAMVVRRTSIELAVTDSHASFFVENKLAIRAEERLALAVFRPASFATVTSAA